MKNGILGLLALALLAALPPTAAEAQEAALDAALRSFWEAEGPAQKKAAIAGVLALDPAFDEVWSQLRQGRPYSRDVDTGLRIRTRKRPFHYSVLVPESYDPARRYPLRVYLHGGVNRPAGRKDGKWWRNYDNFESPDRISVFPVSWDEAM